MTDKLGYEPVRHFGISPERPNYTPCGKRAADVVVTFFPEGVTCDVCIDELATAALRGGAR